MNSTSNHDQQQGRAQSGGFYGGWITDDSAGPFKGEPGIGDWKP